ncbi:zinc-ribbon domain-containing protein [Croceibacterium ferulae]|uniref:zinc-ribbon domain-containing protein n=1 Tax=Croceibacterium ferulae TaxID=1854641 RepID=UPI000EB315A7|nr:zinc-ribbon domain-containing protein [Croceibacterium ferulae]
MMIECPACATRYQVSETAIPPAGRTVRCAKCGESWFQPPPTDEPDEEPNIAAAEDTPPEAMPEDAAEPVAVEAEAPPARPRDRAGQRRLGIWAALIFAVLAGASAAAVSWWGPPEWSPIPRATFDAGRPGLVLDFPADRQEWQQLPDGTEYFGARGTITNGTGSSTDVPPILIVLRDARDRIVYSWEVAPPKKRLAPGESITVREAVTDVPRSARVAEIGWKPV